MKLYSRGRARQSLIDTTVYRAISQVGTVVGYIVLVRGMSEHDFGIFNLLYAVIPVIGAVASFGIDNVLQRYQPEYLGNQQTAAAAWLVRFLGRARLGTNLVVLALIFAGWHLVTPLFKLEPYRAEFAIFSVVILLFFQLRVLEISLSSHMLHKYGVGMFAVLAIAKLIGYSLFILIDDLTLQNAILTDTFAHGAAYAGTYIVHRRLCALPAGTSPVAPSRDERKRLFRYGLYYNFNDVGTLALSSRVDNFFIAAFMDPVAVGTFSFYTRLSGMVSRALPTHMFQNVIRPVFFATPPAEAAIRIPKYFTLMLNTSLLFTVPITAYAAVYHKELVDVVFGGKFREDSLLMPIVLVFVTMRIISVPVALAAQYAEKALVILLSKVFGIVNLLAMLALIPILGVYGAALATGICDVLKNLFIWWPVRHTARWTNFWAAMGATALCWSVFYVLCSTLKSQLPMGPFVQLMLGAAICIVATAAYVRTPVMSSSDREILGSVLKGKERRWLKLAGLVS
ncbi:MAG: oligosaccharide flippase family protein [Steroidobacteraceae bacterium]